MKKLLVLILLAAFIVANSAAGNAEKIYFTCYGCRDLATSELCTHYIVEYDLETKKTYASQIPLDARVVQDSFGNGCPFIIYEFLNSPIGSYHNHRITQWMQDYTFGHYGNDGDIYPYGEKEILSTGYILGMDERRRIYVLMNSIDDSLYGECGVKLIRVDNGEYERIGITSDICDIEKWLDSKYAISSGGMFAWKTGNSLYWFSGIEEHQVELNIRGPMCWLDDENLLVWDENCNLCVLAVESGKLTEYRLQNGETISLNKAGWWPDYSMSFSEKTNKIVLFVNDGECMPSWKICIIDLNSGEMQLCDLWSDYQSDEMLSYSKTDNGVYLFSPTDCDVYENVAVNGWDLNLQIGFRNGKSE